MRWWPVLVLVGCSSQQSDSDSAASGAPSGTTSGALAGSPTGSATGVPTGPTTGTAATGWTPTRYRVVYGWFGVRSQQATTIADVDLFGTPVTWPLQLAVRLADDTVDQGLEPDNHCDVVLTTTADQPAASWTADAGWFAVEFPADAAVSDANCASLPLHPDWAAPGARVTAARWGLAVRPVEQADVDARGGYGPTDPHLGKLLGASWWTTAAPGPVAGGTLTVPGVALANAIDPEGEVLRDANRDFFPLDAADVPAPGGVADAFYELTPLTDWRPASEL